MPKIQIVNCKKKYFYILFIFILLGSIFLLITPVQAIDKNKVSIHLGSREIKRGYTIDKPDGLMRLAVFPYVLDRPADIKLEKISDEGLPQPENLIRVSDVFEFDIVTDPIKIFAKEVIIVLDYNSDNNKTKKIYFYDSNQDKWRPLYSMTNYQDKWVRAYTHLPYSKIAVFEEDLTSEGYATWYRSKYTYGCASNDYPMDSRLRVTSLQDSNQSVICRVKSTGPFTDNAIIDLSLTAFETLAPAGQGKVKVHIEPLEEDNTNVGPTVQGATMPIISAPVAMIYDADNYKVLYEKNSSQKRSIASITKLMTTIVFLETNPDFDKVVTIQDSDKPRPEPGVGIKVKEEDRISVRDLFNAMLTGSANNAALALVRSTGLSQEEFVNRMNIKAKKINMLSTHFADPTGLAVGNKSTSTDIALLINYIMNRPGVRQATTQANYTYHIINENDYNTIKNPLYLFSNSLSSYPVVGAKTGFINEAGYCLTVEFKHNNGREYQAVVLGSSTRNTRISDMVKLIDYAQEFIN
ncbi:MAG: RlpA-like double-psi beta-barrel domain-containing protein [Patescibacteria group bacterium]|nr:RlpA-like double-psi beta-barrel domain-containing protein [Patescibacteria group bacterium]